MNAIGLVFLALASSGGTSPVAMEITMSLPYVTRVTEAHLQASPDWLPDDDNPPLSPREAVDRASRMLQDIEKDNAAYFESIRSISRYETTVREIRLQHVNRKKWLWIVQFEIILRDITTQGPPNLLNLVVLMDGTVIRPSRIADCP